VGFEKDQLLVGVSSTVQTVRSDVVLSWPVQANTSVDYSTIESAGARAFVDYVPTSGTLVFGAGTDRLPISVTVLPHSGPRATGQFTVLLNHPNGAILGQQIQSVYLLDNLLSSVIDYLLGNSASADGLDFNADARVDVADVVTRVGQLPPTAPANPQPANAAPGTAVSTILAWNESARASAYSVYLWPASASRPGRATASALTQPLFDPPGDLSFETTYRWQVVAFGIGGATAGPIWIFTTEAGADITVLASAEQTVWTVGSRARIPWKLALDAGTSCRFELWRGDAKVADLGTDFSPSGGGDFSLIVPELATAGDYQLRVFSVWLESIGQPRPYVEIPVAIGRLP